MRTVEIKCDSCDKDLTHTGNCEGYYLVLGSASKSYRGSGAVTMVAVQPPTDREYHFCGMTCMDTWRDAARSKAAKQKAWRDANSKDLGGGMRTYPPLPDELR